jgi:hypothetical protein
VKNRGLALCVLSHELVSTLALPRSGSSFRPKSTAVHFGDLQRNVPQPPEIAGHLPPLPLCLPPPSPPPLLLPEYPYYKHPKK